MRLKILSFVLVCLLLLVYGGSKLNRAKAALPNQEDPQMTEQKGKQKNSMKDIVSITTALADYITDRGAAPQQNGACNENFEFYKTLAPYYIRNLPVYDGWGNSYRVYCGEACNGKYGISGCREKDFVVVSYGRDGKKEDWVFDPSNPEAGLYELETLDDFDKDIIIWNAAWIRAPKLKK